MKQKNIYLKKAIVSTTAGIVLIGTSLYYVLDTISDLEKTVEVQADRISQQDVTLVNYKQELSEAVVNFEELAAEMEQMEKDYEDTLHQKDSHINALVSETQKLERTVRQLKEQQKASQSPKMPKDVKGTYKEMTVHATAYDNSPEENGGTYNGHVLTKTGFSLTANPKAKVIAVDPNVIPLGSTVYVEGYGYAKALDTGGAIKGNRIDVFIADQSKVREWGRKDIKIRVYY